MYQNKKFENAARKRRQYALALAVFVHLAFLVAIASGGKMTDLVPPFLAGFFDGTTVSKAPAPQP